MGLRRRGDGGVVAAGRQLRRQLGAAGGWLVGRGGGPGDRGVEGLHGARCLGVALWRRTVWAVVATAAILGVVVLGRNRCTVCLMSGSTVPILRGAVRCGRPAERPQHQGHRSREEPEGRCPAAA